MGKEHSDDDDYYPQPVAGNHHYHSCLPKLAEDFVAAAAEGVMERGVDAAFVAAVDVAAAASVAAVVLLDYL